MSDKELIIELLMRKGESKVNENTIVHIAVRNLIVHARIELGNGQNTPKKDCPKSIPNEPPN